MAGLIGSLRSIASENQFLDPIIFQQLPWKPKGSQEGSMGAAASTPAYLDANQAKLIADEWGERWDPSKFDDAKDPSTGLVCKDKFLAAKNPVKREWKAVLDKRNGRTYYYDTLTHETRWDKPLDEEEVQVRFGVVFTALFLSLLCILETGCFL
jgi:hypothetical protein